MKTCIDCQKELPLADFPAHQRRGKTHRLARCRPCNRAYDADRYQASKDVEQVRYLRRRDPVEAACDSAYTAWVKRSALVPALSVAA